MVHTAVSAPYLFLHHFLKIQKSLTAGPFSELMKDEGYSDSDTNAIFTSTVTLDFQKVRVTRSYTGCRVTPILSCLHARALELMLEENQDFKEKWKEADKSKMYMPLLILPIPTQDHPAFAQGRLCNHWIPGTLALSLSEPDLLLRLQNASKSFEAFETSGLPRIFSKMRSLFHILPIRFLRPLVELGKYPHYFSQTSLLLSSSTTPCKLVGENVSKTYFCTSYHPSANLRSGVLMYTFTKGEEMDICIRGSSPLFKGQEDLDNYAQKYLVASLEEHFNKLCQNE